MTVFKQYYLSKFTGRQLNWKLNQGSAELRARIGNNGTKRYEITVSTLQMVILTMFNDQQKVTYGELLQNMQTTDHELKSHLIPLCKFKILDKFPKESEFKNEDFFQVNFSYQNNSFKIKLPVLCSKQQKTAETDELTKKVDDDRKLIIDAAIVRIMKSRKRLDHPSLLLETTRHLQTKFMPDPLMIKKRIEGLIDREYLERDKDDKKYYNYLA